MISKETIDYFVKSSDRWIRIKKENGKIIGINFMQDDSHPLFLDYLSNGNEVNVELTRFYLLLKKTFESVLSEKEEIDRVIWLWLEDKI